MVRTASVYSDLKKVPGEKVLVTRLWPRGIRKPSVSLWLKELGPRYEVLRRFKDGKMRWSAFRKAYLAGLKSPESQTQLKELKALSSRKSVTLLCVCKDEAHCHRSLLIGKLTGRPRRNFHPKAR